MDLGQSHYCPLSSIQIRKAYQKIWYDEGSPLLIHTEELVNNLQTDLGNHNVVMAMRYGQPSIESGLKLLSDEEDIIVLPLYPQYAGATTPYSAAQGAGSPSKTGTDIELTQY